MASDSLAGDSRASQVQAACIAFFVLSPLFVGARVFARVKERSWSGLSWDDGTLFLGWIFSVVLGAVVMAACAAGFGQRFRNLTNEDRMMQQKLTWLADIFYKLSINTTKASILFFYLRRFVTPWFKIASNVTLSVVLSFMVATVITTITQCNPVQGYWSNELGLNPKCIDARAFWYAYSGISIFISIVMLLLPFQPIHTSSLPSGQKIALIVIFAIGAFTTITGAIRMQTRDWQMSGVDPHNVDWLMWTVIETNLAILCGCIPVYRPLMAYIFPKQFASTSKIRPGDNRRNTLAVFSRSEVSLAPSARAKRFTQTSIAPHRKPGGWDADSEKGLDGLPLPPGIKDPNAAPRRSSMLRDAYVWLNTVI